MTVHLELEIMTKVSILKNNFIFVLVPFLFKKKKKKENAISFLIITIATLFKTLFSNV